MSFFSLFTPNTLQLSIFLLLSQNSKAQTYDSRPTVNLNQGTIIGVKVYPDVPRVAINAFLGIPYAEAPEGHLRFAIPARHRGWNGTMYAAKYKPVCPFRTTSYDNSEKEDCLYLNIWTPEGAYGRKLPVLVFFESEQLFNSKQSNLIRIPGHDLASESAVIISVSYRQNIFGFFCLGTNEARGNLGLLDQYLALLWIKENISQFGGNPNLVTLMGYGSSTITIMYHLISPRTTGLFSRVIIMPGNAIVPWLPKDPIAISNKLTEDLGCGMTSPKQTMECLRSKSIQELLRSFDHQNEDNIWDKSIIPVTESFLPEKDRYLPYSMNKALQNGYLKSMPILTGITDFFSNAEQWRWSDINQDFSQLTQYAEESVIPTIIQKYGYDGVNRDHVKDIIRWKYLWSVADDTRALDEHIHRLQWDALYAAPHDKQLRLLANLSMSSVYAYYLHMPDNLANVSSTMPSIGGDLLLLFGPVLLQQIARRRFNVVEDRLSKQLKTLWINFAKNGYPSTGGYQDVWQPYNNSSRYVKYLGNGHWNSVDYENGINLWNKLLPRFIKTSGMVNSIPKELQLSPDPAAGFRHALYTLVGLVIALLALLLVCVVLLKRRAKERTRHMGF